MSFFCAPQTKKYKWLSPTLPIFLFFLVWSAKIITSCRSSTPSRTVRKHLWCAPWKFGRDSALVLLVLPCVSKLEKVESSRFFVIPATQLQFLFETYKLVIQVSRFGTMLLEKHFDILSLHPRYLCYSASRLEFSGFEGFEPILLLPGCGEFVNLMYMMCKLSENLEAGSTDVASKFAYKFSKYPGRDGIGGTKF